MAKKVAAMVKLAVVCRASHALTAGRARRSVSTGLT